MILKNLYIAYSGYGKSWYQWCYWVLICIQWSILKKTVAQGFTPFSHWFHGWECCQKCNDTKFKLPKMVGNVEEEKSFTSFDNHIDNRLIRISTENINLK